MRPRRPECVRAALDCPGGIAGLELITPGFAADPALVMLLGRLSAHQLASVRAGEPLVVMSWPIDVSGRNIIVGSAIVTADGEVRAAARGSWITSR